MGKRRHVASGRLYRGCPWLRLGPQEARAAPPPASCLELFRRGRAALRQAAAALPHTWCACRAAFRQRVPVKHAADRRLRGRKVIGLPARARHDERRAPPWPVRSRAYHLNEVKEKDEYLVNIVWSMAIATLQQRISFTSSTRVFAIARQPSPSSAVKDCSRFHVIGWGCCTSWALFT